MFYREAYYIVRLIGAVASTTLSFNSYFKSNDITLKIVCIIMFLISIGFFGYLLYKNTPILRAWFSFRGKIKQIQFETLDYSIEIEILNAQGDAESREMKRVKCLKNDVKSYLHTLYYDKSGDVSNFRHNLGGVTLVKDEKISQSKQLQVTLEPSCEKGKIYLQVFSAKFTKAFPSDKESWTMEKSFLGDCYSRIQIKFPKERLPTKIRAEKFRVKNNENNNTPIGLIEAFDVVELQNLYCIPDDGKHVTYIAESRDLEIGERMKMLWEW